MFYQFQCLHCVFVGKAIDSSRRLFRWLTNSIQNMKEIFFNVNQPFYLRFRAFFNCTCLYLIQDLDMQPQKERPLMTFFFQSVERFAETFFQKLLLFKHIPDTLFSCIFRHDLFFDNKQILQKFYSISYHLFC